MLPGHKKPKSLAEHCKEAVVDKQGEEEGALVPIRNRLTGRVHGHQTYKLECKKALADMYYGEIEK